MKNYDNNKVVLCCALGASEIIVDSTWWMRPGNCYLFNSFPIDHGVSLEQLKWMADTDWPTSVPIDNTCFLHVVFADEVEVDGRGAALGCGSCYCDNDAPAHLSFAFATSSTPVTRSLNCHNLFRTHLSACTQRPIKCWINVKRLRRENKQVIKVPVAI